jgi:hypothetical protein
VVAQLLVSGSLEPQLLLVRREGGDGPVMRPGHVGPPDRPRHLLGDADVLEASLLRQADLLDGLIRLLPVELLAEQDRVADREAHRLVHPAEEYAQRLELVEGEVWSGEEKAGD